MEQLGAILQNGECVFRVWAPHAQQVCVLLQTGLRWQNQDPQRRVCLTRDSSGYWSGLVDDVDAGRLYRYEIEFEGHKFQRLDPAGRDTIHSQLTRDYPDSENASIVTARDFLWSGFKTPELSDFNIYQLHCGSFAGRGDGLGVDVAGFAHIETKLGYIQELGFSAIELLPVQEFAMERSWGYNPAAFFAIESAYGHPTDLKRFVDQSHQHGLAVIFDVVYNHAGPGDNLLWRYDGYHDKHDQYCGGIYFEGGRVTDWGRGPAWWKEEVQEYFFQNACMYFDDYNADGLRFDVTTQIEGQHLSKVMQRLRERYPDKYFIAEHLPAHPWITTYGNFNATWQAESHHEAQRALNGQEPVNKVKSILGWDGFEHSWNLVKYPLGSHDDVGDDHNGNAKEGLTHWDARHRYLVDQFGGRHNWHARAKCRVAWALGIAMPGTPMLFMGSECHMGSPTVAWGYWHDGWDNHGDHRFDWEIAGDPIGIEMRRLVQAGNGLRAENHALLSESLIITHEDYHNQVLAFKRWHNDNLVLTIVNLSENNFGNHSYGVSTDNQFGTWSQILCTQDAQFGGWHGSGNAFHDPQTQRDGKIYINLPKWSVVIFRLCP
ncbi:MAG: alpha-amylase family glycosyl hydrolase [Pirellulaceae bacterium]